MLNTSCHKILILGSALAALLLGGCVTAPNIDVNKAAAAQLKRVAVLTIPEPINVGVMNMGAAMGFGIIGGLVQGDVNADHSKQFAAALQKQKVSFAVPLQAAVEQALRQDGFQVVEAPDQKPKLAADGKSDYYSGVQVDADAFLVVWYESASYFSSANSFHYQPMVLIKVRLLDAKTKEDLYDKTFAVGYKLPIANEVHQDAPDQYRFGSFGDLMARLDQAAAGIVACGQITATEIGQDLKVHP